MRYKISFIAVLFISSLISSCESDDFDHQNDFENSHNAWLNFKESSNNSYKYLVLGGSVFTTYGWETTITVSNGIITQRDFKYTSEVENIPQDQLEWTENENEINTHNHTSAMYALTLDEIYDKAKKEWLIKRKNAEIHLETENNGLISTCGYVENGCMDDCFNGVHIKSIIVF